MNDRNNDRIDETDQRILALLQHNSAATIQSIAAVIGLSASTVHERIRKLEARSSDGRTTATPPTLSPPPAALASDTRAAAPVILGYEARIDPGALGLGLLAFVFVRADERVGVGEAGRCLAAIPEVQEVHHIAGEDCYLVKLRTQDTASLGRLLRERFAAVPAIQSTRTTIVLDTIKETARLPITIAAPDGSDAFAGEIATTPPPGVVDMMESATSTPTGPDGAASTASTTTGREPATARRSRQGMRPTTHTNARAIRRRESK